MKLFFVSLFLISQPFQSSCQSHSCSFVDESKGYAVSWSVGIGFVDFVMSQKNFPARSAHWTGIGFGNGTIQLALIESQYGRVSVSSAGLYGAQPPLKIPTANMVTRGSGSIVNFELRVSFSIPVYYFKGCSTWWFFTSPTQVGMPYTDTPIKRMICNVNEVCKSSNSPLSFNRGKRQTNIDLNNLLNYPINANIDFTGGVNSNTDGQFNVNYNPYNTQNNGFNTQSNGYNTPNNNGYNTQSTMYNTPYQVPASASLNCVGGNCNPSINGNFFDTRNPNANSLNGSNLQVENPNYKFLPDGYNQQFDQSAGRQRLFDQSGNGMYNGVTTTDSPVLSNEEQNRKNYQTIQSTNPSTNGRQYTNNIYGYDYRSNPGTRYTINGNIDIKTASLSSGDESMYQPPQVNSLNGRRRRMARNARNSDGIKEKRPNDSGFVDQVALGRKKRLTNSNIIADHIDTSENKVEYDGYNLNSRPKRRSAYAGTAYNNQDLKFPREENTIPMSPQFDALNGGSFNGDNNFGGSQNTNTNTVGSMYYPYRTTTNNNLGQSSVNNIQFDQSSVNSNRNLGTTNFNSNQNFGTTNTNNNNVREFYDTNNGITSVQFRDSTAGNVRLYDPKNDPTVQFTDNRGSETKPVEVIRQYDDPQCVGSDPYWCRNYVKTYTQGASGNNLGQTQCASLRQSLLHSDHHCCQTVKQAGC